jgi:TetR/AcrR family transcriptional repressor of nem operon
LKDTSKRDFSQGCPLGNLLQESLINDNDFAKLLKSIFSQWRDLFEQTLQKAINNNEIKNINTKEVSLFLIASFEGALLLSKQSKSSIEFDICVKQLEIYLNSFRN